MSIRCDRGVRSLGSIFIDESTVALAVDRVLYEEAIDKFRNSFDL